MAVNNALMAVISLIFFHLTCSINQHKIMQGFSLKWSSIGLLSVRGSKIELFRRPLKVKFNNEDPWNANNTISGNPHPVKWRYQENIVFVDPWTLFKTLLPAVKNPCSIMKENLTNYYFISFINFRWLC